MFRSVSHVIGRGKERAQTRKRETLGRDYFQEGTENGAILENSREGEGEIYIRMGEEEKNGMVQYYWKGSSLKGPFSGRNCIIPSYPRARLIKPTEGEKGKRRRESVRDDLRY